MSTNLNQPQTGDAPPSAAAILERARSMCSEGCYMVDLQRRRLRSVQPEYGMFLCGWWADLQFLIVSLRRLQRAAHIATHVPQVRALVTAAIEEFKAALRLDTMRNIGEHIDEYAVDHPRRHDGTIGRRDLQVGSWDGTTYSWLGHQLNIDAALVAAEKLFLAVRQASEQVRAPE